MNNMPCASDSASATPEHASSTTSLGDSWGRYGRWCLLLPAPIAGLYWGKGHVLPTITCCSFTLALGFMALAGTVAQRLIDGSAESADGDRPRPGIFQLLWLGQYTVVAVTLALSVPAALLHEFTAWKVPLRVSLPLAIALIAVVARRRSPQSSAWRAPDFDSICLAGVTAFAAYRALSLHSAHAGALGHDTQQHIYWTQHIADYGFLPATSRDSDLLDSYPKFFHLLAAAWGSVGVSNILGPYVKIMPFMQAALACGFLCELLLVARSSGRERSLAPLVMGLFLCWHLTYGDGQQVYPYKDLSGTPRASAGWVMFGPPLLVLAHWVGTFRDVRPWLIGSFPVFVALAIGVNPVTLVLLFSYSVPLTLIWFFAARKENDPQHPVPWAKALAVGSSAAVMCLLTNPFVLGLLARRPWGVAALNWFGIRTVAASIGNGDWSLADAKSGVLCRADGWSCGYELLTGSISETFAGYLDELPSGDFLGLNRGSRAFCYWLVLAAPLFMIAIYALRAPKLASVDARGARLFLWIVGASVLAAIGRFAVNALLARLSVLGSLMTLLATYYRQYGGFLGPWLLVLLPWSSWLVMRRLVVPQRVFRGALAAALALAVFGLSSFEVPALAKHRDARKEFKIDWRELRAVRHVNQFVPKHEAVLITGKHWVSRHGEHVLVADDPVGLLLPYLTTRLLFGINLGSGHDYDWQDLSETFCGKSASARQRLLRQANARWVLARGDDVTSRAAFERLQWDCGVKLKQLDAEYPAAWSEHDLALFRINP